MFKVTDLSAKQEANAFIEKLEVDPFFLFKTSGSTGQPKELIFNKEQLRMSAELTAQTFGLNQRSVLLCPLSIDYVAGKMMVARAWFLDAQLIYLGASGNPYEQAQKERIDFAAFVPLQLQKMLTYPQAIAWLNGMKNIIVGGAAVSQQLVSSIQKHLSVPVFHTYGMTETLTHVAIKPLNGNEASTRYKALSGVELSIDERNCLKVKSPINKQWLQTNDVVELVGNQFEWLGRADFVINSGGFKIHPERVEAATEKLFGLETVLMGIPDEKLGEKAILICLKKDAAFDLKELSEKLHPYEMPKEIRTVEQFPRLENGKLDRVALRMQLMSKPNCH